MWWLETTELRPDQSAVASIPAQTILNYWLAIQVFSSAGGGWYQSTIRETRALRVPALELAFNDYSADEPLTGCGRTGVTLSILYGDSG